MKPDLIIKYPDWFCFITTCCDLCGFLCICAFVNPVRLLRIATINTYFTVGCMIFWSTCIWWHGTWNWFYLLVFMWCSEILSRWGMESNLVAEFIAETGADSAVAYSYLQGMTQYLEMYRVAHNLLCQDYNHHINGGFI